jgi:WD40 repeat protein
LLQLEGSRAAFVAAVVVALSNGFLLSSWTSPSLVAAEEEKDAPAAVSYYRDVRPVFQARCQGCHQPAKARGKFVITSFTKILEGVDGEAVLLPGKPDESLLVKEITPDNGKASMPKGGEALSPFEIDLISRWIAEGAKDDSPELQRREYSMENPPVYEGLPVLTALDYSPDGTLLAVAGYHEVLLHKSDGSGTVARLVGLSERIESLAFSADGKSLAVTGGVQGQSGEVQIWDVAGTPAARSGGPKLRLSVPVTYDTIYGVSWSPDSKLVAFGCTDTSVRVIDAGSGKEVLFQGAHGDWVLGTAFSVDSSHLVSVSRDRTLKLIKVDTQQFIDNITSITPGALKGGLMAIDCHPTKDELLVGGADGVPKIYRMHREKKRTIGDDFNLILKFDAMQGRIFSTKFDSDGTRIVTGSSFNNTGEVRVYQVEEGKLLWKIAMPGAIYSVAFSPDGKTAAACGFDGVVILMDSEEGRITKRFVPVPIERLARSF